MASFKRKLISNIRNIQSGAKVPYKIVIIESDDWGSNRIASKEDFDGLVKAGILKPDCSVYDRCDSIACSEDISCLFEVLSKYKGQDGKSAVISAFVNPVNPDFEKIKASDYSEYFYETFLETLAKEGEDKKVHSLWMDGIDNHLIYPEYHGREHLTTPLWMEQLKRGNEMVKKAFEYHYYAVPIKEISSVADQFRPTLYFENNEQKEWLKVALNNGLDVMQKIFGYTPISFAPSNGVSHPDFDKVLFDRGIVGLHNPHRFEPDGNGGGIVADYGRLNQLGQTYYNRNCVFEPVQRNYDTVDFCMAQIQGAFNWHKVAIISSHRVNYMGSIDPSNRSKGLKELDRLLSSIVKKWSDVRFMTTDDYISLIRNK